MGMAYVRIFYDWLEITGGLSEDEKGRLIDGIIRYARDGEIVDLPGGEKFLFPIFIQRQDRDIKKYQQKCEREPHAYARTSLSNKELSNKELSNKESSNKEPSVLKINNNWRTSARARGAVAQQIVDIALLEELPCAGFKNLHENIQDYMEQGLEPEEILSCCRQADGINLGSLLYSALQERGLRAR